jgi:hypothetical protein
MSRGATSEKFFGSVFFIQNFFRTDLQELTDGINNVTRKM